MLPAAWQFVFRCYCGDLTIEVANCGPAAEAHHSGCKASITIMHTALFCLMYDAS